MSNMSQISIESHKGSYSVYFEDNILEDIDMKGGSDEFYIIDKNFLELYSNKLTNFVENSRYYEIEPNENQKSLELFPKHVEYLLGKRLRRNETLIAIGGGIIQDITAFLAATLFRGMEWKFIPTTLLSQADSCIGSKSSVNVESAKNILGTFLPPRDIRIDLSLLDTLKDSDLYSGIGEIIKIHIIHGQESFYQFESEQDNLLKDKRILKKYVEQSLIFKKRFIEADEFDKGIRNVMNYGHTFGHAIEVASGYKIPHGVAVSIGIDLSNYFALKMGKIHSGIFSRMHQSLEKIYRGFTSETIKQLSFFDSLSKDKKNEGKRVAVIHLNERLVVEKNFYSCKEDLEEIIKEYFQLSDFTFC